MKYGNMTIVWQAVFTFNPYLQIYVNKLQISVNQLETSLNEVQLTISANNY